MLKQFCKLGLLSVSVASLAACGTYDDPYYQGNQGYGSQRAPQQYGQLPQQYGPQNGNAQTQSQNYGAGGVGAGYLLGTRDVIQIQVLEDARLNGQYTVDGRGDITMNMIGTLNIQGKSIEQVKQQVVASLQNGYIRQPNVNVNMVSYRPYFILGEVNMPSEYAFQNGLTVMHAVTIAGGFKYRANKKVVFIQHAGQVGERQYRLDSPVMVYPGDTIRIAERRF